METSCLPIIGPSAASGFITSQQASFSTFMPKTPIADDISTNPLLKKWIFHPESPKHIAWNFVSLFCILYQAVFIPYRLGFDIPVTGNFGYIEFGMTVFFILDMCET